MRATDVLRARHTRSSPWTAICVSVAIGERARQGSNLQPPDLESGALPIRATDPAAVRAASGLRSGAVEFRPSLSLCERVHRQAGQNFWSASLSVVVFLFLVVV